jgi:hypothetical protein
MLLKIRIVSQVCLKVSKPSKEYSVHLFTGQHQTTDGRSYPPHEVYACISGRQNAIDSGSEVLSAVVMKSSVFWDTTPSSPLNVNRCFGGTNRLHLQDRRISQSESRW